MKIKEVQAGVKLTKNYDSYQISLAADLEIGEDSEKVGEELMEKALRIVSKKIGGAPQAYPEKIFKKDFLLGANNNFEEKKNKEEEVGAAWFHKKTNALLSVKMNEGGDWEHVKISDLEKVEGGYKRETNEGIFVFRKIPEGKRKNNKMPVFRIYKI